MTSLDSNNATSPHSRKSESGVTLPMVAMMMVTLLGLAAFAVDLGWFYLNASRIQRAADASALAGVIHMPTDLTEASIVAHEIARTNGYLDLELPTVYPHVEAVAVVSKPTQLRVTVTEEVPTFFLKVFGMGNQVITRSAQAEFVPPIPLGSPDNQFGNSCDPSQAGCVGQANFWANIHGRYTDNEMGDAYSSACTNGSGNPGCALNPLWDDGGTSPGYLYGVERAGAGVSFTVEFNDVEFHNDSGGLPTGDYVRTGDHGCGPWGGPSPSAANCGPTVQLSLYEPDPDPLDLTNNVLICRANLGPLPQVLPAAPYSWTTPSGCVAGSGSNFTVLSPQAGIYVVQVRVLNTGPDPDGLNRYSLRSTLGSRLYAIDNMSIYNNAAGSTTAFHLAEVASAYQGKTFVVELYDAGESAGTGSLQVIDPSGSIYTGSCEVFSRDNVTDPWVQHPTPANCSESVTPQEYHTRWLKFEIGLPNPYPCGPCWWKMNYAYTTAVNDTTTWRAYILGNPIHLVPVG